MQPGSGATVYLLDPQSLQHPLVVGDSAWTASGFIGSYIAHYGALNPWLPSINAFPRQYVSTSPEYRGAENLPRTEFFNDWLRPQGLDGGMGTVLSYDANRIMILSLLYGGVPPETVGQTRALLARLAPMPNASPNCIARSTVCGRPTCRHQMRWTAYLLPLCLSGETDACERPTALLTD